MLNVNVSAFVNPVIHQRRFRYLLAALILLSVLLGLVIVPIEQTHPESHITNWFDGIWWSFITVTGVGYGDMVPVTVAGKIIGLVLVGLGVVAFGLVVAMFGLALEGTKDRYYRLKLFEQLDDISARLDRLEKGERYLLKKNLNDDELRDD